MTKIKLNICKHLKIYLFNIIAFYTSRQNANYQDNKLHNYLTTCHDYLIVVHPTLILSLSKNNNTPYYNLQL